MEELFCIGCGAPIQTENKEGLGYTPQSALEKGLETGEVYCQRCFRLRHYNEITDVHLTDDDFLKLLHEVGDSDALVVNVVDIFDFNGSVIPGLPRFVAGNDVLLVGNKKDILPKSVKDSKVIHWLMERAHEEGMRPVDVVLTSAQNKSAIKDLMGKIELGTRISSRLPASQGRHWTRSKSHWTMDPTSTIHQGLSIATRWLTT